MNGYLLEAVGPQNYHGGRIGPVLWVATDDTLWRVLSNS